jgi:hypothetical protein
MRRFAVPHDLADACMVDAVLARQIAIRRAGGAFRADRAARLDA